MPETTANDANYEEIRGHLDIIKAKLAKPTDGDTRASLNEDLEDYYERALQLRVMQNTTQREELLEQTQQVDGLRRRARRRGAMLAAVAAAAATMAAELALPGSLMAVLSDPMVAAVGSHAAVAAVVAVATLVAAK